MKIEFLPDGSPDCPLVRLYDFDASQASNLQSAVLRLASSFVAEVAVLAEAVNGCSLILQSWSADQGIVPNGRSGTSFVCRLSRSSWQTVAELVAPFCISPKPGQYQWLNETSAISWLLSPDGSW